MNALASLEAFCANAVERTFAIAFPSALEPVQVARKLVARYESAREPVGMRRRYLVKLSRVDYARFSTERTYFERQWTAMLRGLAERTGRERTALPFVEMAEARLPTGVVEIDVSDLSGPPPALALRAQNGATPGVAYRLDRELVIGRDRRSDIVVADARVSRRHAAIERMGGGIRIRDLASSNGVRINEETCLAAELHAGDTVQLGDTVFNVEIAVGPGL